MKRTAILGSAAVMLAVISAPAQAQFRDALSVSDATARDTAASQQRIDDLDDQTMLLLTDRSPIPLPIPLRQEALHGEVARTFPAHGVAALPFRDTPKSRLACGPSSIRPGPRFGLGMGVDL